MLTLFYVGSSVKGRQMELLLCFNSTSGHQVLQSVGGSLRHTAHSTVIADGLSASSVMGQQPTASPTVATLLSFKTSFVSFRLFEASLESK